MDPSEYYTYEDRAYINPTLSRDEQLGFVDTLRNTIKDNTAQINTQTRNLGTNITPNYGGLTGSNSYFTQRYQTTPVEAQVKTLKATAQAKALNDLMTNYQTQAQNRYNQAYRNYSKRSSSGSGTGTGGSGDDNGDYTKGINPNDKGTGELPGVLPIGSDVWGDRSVTMYMDRDNGYRIIKDSNTGEILQVLNKQNELIGDNDPYYRRMADNLYHSTNSEEYRNAVSNEYWANVGRDALNVAGWVTLPGYKIGETIGRWITGDPKTTYTGN